jgi:hypothetical protein
MCRILLLLAVNRVLLYGEIVALFSEFHTEYINTLCGQNVELLNVKLGGTVHTVTTEL